MPAPSKTTEERLAEIDNRLGVLEKRDEREAKVAAETNADVSLKQYTAILALQTNEATVYATRTQVFLVAHSIFMGFVLGQLPTGALADVSYTKLGLLQVAAGAGLVLWFLWACSLRLGRRWLTHWLTLLSPIEEAAFTGAVLLRGKVSGPKQLFGKIGVLTVPFLGSLLFLVLWIGVFAYAGYCMHLKTIGVAIP